MLQVIQKGSMVEVKDVNAVSGCVRWLGPGIVTEKWSECQLSSGVRSASYYVEGHDLEFGFFHGRWTQENIRLSQSAIKPQTLAAMIEQERIRSHPVEVCA